MPLRRPSAAWLATRFSKHRTLMVTTTAYSLGLCTVVFLPRSNLLATVPVMFWCGFMASGFDLMIRAMLADVGDEVRLVGFGTFSVASRAASEGRNPRTGEKIKIAASKQAKFKPGKGLRDSLN